jgi:hypothetical protein
MCAVWPCGRCGHRPGLRWLLPLPIRGGTVWFTCISRQFRQRSGMCKLLKFSKLHRLTPGRPTPRSPAGRTRVKERNTSPSRLVMAACARLLISEKLVEHQQQAHVGRRQHQRQFPAHNPSLQKQSVTPRRACIQSNPDKCTKCLSIVSPHATTQRGYAVLRSQLSCWRVL